MPRSDRLSNRPPTIADSAGAPGSSPSCLVRIADSFAFSSGLAAALGATLTLIASRILDAPEARSWALLVGGGTFVVYNLDRLRDVDRDRSVSPLRTAFVLRNRRSLYAAVGIVSIGSATLLLTAPLPILLLCMLIGGVGLLHRRLKAVSALKAVYVSLAWVAACVGIPWIASGRYDAGLWVAGILLASLAANLIASNLPDEEAEFVHHSAMLSLRAARGMALLAIGITFAAPAPLRPLVWIPVCEGLVLATFRPTERYGHVAVDGALLIGALATWAHLGSTL
jgi:hypothetical protein